MDHGCGAVSSDVDIKAKAHGGTAIGADELQLAAMQGNTKPQKSSCDGAPLLVVHVSRY